MKDINSATDNKDWLEIPTGPTGVRPSNPVAGQMRFDTTESVLEYYNPVVTGWKMVTNSGAGFMIATGGTITTDGDYKVHTFNSSATFTVTTLGDIATVSYLVVAGGGAGGGTGGGGGGAGGYKTATGFSVSATAYSITVGGGGAGSSSTQGGSGGNSVFSSITSTGGGGGGGT